MKSPLLQPSSLKNDGKFRSMSVSLPDDLVEALTHHFGSGDRSKYILYLIQKDLTETGCVVDGGRIVNPAQTSLSVDDSLAISQNGPEEFATPTKRPKDHSATLSSVR